MSDKDLLLMAYGAMKAVSNDYNGKPLIKIIERIEAHLWPPPPPIVVPAGTFTFSEEK